MPPRFHLKIMSIAHSATDRARILCSSIGPDGEMQLIGNFLFVQNLPLDFPRRFQAESKADDDTTVHHDTSDVSSGFGPNIPNPLETSRSQISATPDPLQPDELRPHINQGINTTHSWKAHN